MPLSPKILTTDRLILRPFTISDAADLVCVINDLDVSKWLTRIRHPYSIVEAHWFIGSVRNPWRFAITLRDTGTVIGSIEIGHEFGYWLGQSYWRKGYMSEAAGTVVDLWMSQYGDTLTASYFVGNTGSKTILLDLGFEHSENSRKFSKAQQKEVETHILTLTPMRYHAHKAH